MALLLRLLQEHFASGVAACIEVDGLWLRLDNGALWVDAGDPRVRALVAPGGDLDAAARDLAPRLAGRPAVAAADRPPSELAGPYRAAPLLGALALVGVRPESLEMRLGGRDQRLAVAIPAVDVGPLSAESMALIDRLQAQPTLGELLRGESGAAPDETLSALVVLLAFGIVVPAERPQAAGEDHGSLRRRLAQRIAEHLDRAPLDLDTAAHRRRIADRFQQLGACDHYAFLEVARGSDEAAITAGFEAVARLVHPRHARRLGLAADDAMLASLFARAVEAYYTLIDVDRRIAYNRDLASAPPPPAIDDEQRRREKQSLADESVSRALLALRDQDVSSAVDLLKQAARLAPSADTLALLARAQARNPAWRQHARYSWQEALALRRDWPEAHAALAELLERMGDEPAAIQHYQQALSLDPGSGDVQAALSRLGAAPAAAGRRKLPWRR